MSDSTVVTITPSIMDGLVMRWYPSLNAANLRDEMVSASRNRVSIHVDELTPLIEEWINQAKMAHSILACGDETEIREMVQMLETHRTSKLFGPFEPIGGAS